MCVTKSNSTPDATIIAKHIECMPYKVDEASFSDKISTLLEMKFEIHA